jgi:hypothetical protein
MAYMQKEPDQSSMAFAKRYVTDVPLSDMENV